MAVDSTLAGRRLLTTAIVAGALAPSVVALFIVFPLKGQPVAGGWDPAVLVGALLVNGAWGLGVATVMRFLERPEGAVG